MSRASRFLFLCPLAISGCVVEQVVDPRPPLPTLLHGGAAHNVSLYFEVAPDDFPDVPRAREYIEEHQALPPSVIVPEIEPGGRELYRIPTR
jgi:hypothetical protein